MATEQLKMRFGEIAVEKGFITQEQLSKCLDEQSKHHVSEGLGRRTIGSILCRGGYMTIEQVVDVLKAIKA